MCNACRFRLMPTDPDLYASVSSGMSQPTGGRYSGPHCGVIPKQSRDMDTQTDATLLRDAEVAIDDVHNA